MGDCSKYCILRVGEDQQMEDRNKDNFSDKYYNKIYYKRVSEGGVDLIESITQNLVKRDDFLVTKHKDSPSGGSNREIPEYCLLVDVFEGNNANESKKVYRIKESLGELEKCPESHANREGETDEAEDEKTSINDAGCIIINDYSRKDGSEGENTVNGIKDTQTIVLKTNYSSTKNLKDHYIIKNHKSNSLFVIIKADDLRSHGIKISRGLSWESTMIDFIRQFRDPKNPNIIEFSKLPHLIVLFGNEGAIYYRNDDCVRLEGEETNSIVKYAVLFYDAKYTEGEKESHYKGTVQGTMSAFVAGFTAEMCKRKLSSTKRKNASKSDSKSSRNKAERLSLFEVRQSMYSGIAASKRFLEHGYGESENNNIIGEKDKICQEFKNLSEMGQIFEKKLKIRKVPNILIPMYQSGINLDTQNWSIINFIGENNSKKFATEYIKSEDLPNMDTYPVAKFGDLITYDKSEIEKYKSIITLIKNFCCLKTHKEVCAIAIFGPPGSGKSFAFKELVKNIEDSFEIQFIEFNISQFTSPNDLSIAFHQIRNIGLNGKIPIVFFDEFDTQLNGKHLGWLQYFLAPIQDDEFKDGNIIHKIGKAIFVFAGGTSSNYSNFVNGESDSTIDELSKHNVLFKEAKGTDFVSRLKGYVDILGPNPNDLFDSFWKIRRAVLLRSLIKKHLRDIINEKDKNADIDEHIINAMLNVPEYKHGTRSMEAIIKMSSLHHKNRFDPSDLPSSQLLDLHVDTKCFFELLNEETGFTSENYDDIAKNIFFDTRNSDELGDDIWTASAGSDEAYKKMRTSLDSEWENLNNNYKEKYIRTAEFIPEILKILGISVEEKTDDDKLNKIFMPNFNILDYIACLEHDRWIIDSVSLAWTYSKNKLSKMKSHDSLIPYLYLNDSLDSKICVKEYTTKMESGECLSSKIYAINYITNIQNYLNESNLSLVCKKKPANEILKAINNYYSNKGSKLNLLNKNLLIYDEERVEEIAKRLHEHFCKLKEVYYKNKYDVIFRMSWEELPDNVKDRIRDSARRMPKKFAEINCSYIPFYGEDNKPEDHPSIVKEFDCNDIQKLAEIEHKTWITELINNGWRYGECIERDKKLTPNVVPWDYSDRDVRRAVRDYIIDIPKIMLDNGIFIYKLGYGIPKKESGTCDTSLGP